MAYPGISGTPRKSRTFVLVVTLCWVLALAGGGFLIWFWQTGGFASATTTTLAPTTTAALSTTEGSTTTATEEPTTTTTTVPPQLTVAAGGDVQGDRKVGTFIDKNSGAAAFAGVKPYLETADIAFVNLEGPISNTGTRNQFKEYTFRSRPALMDGLTSAGIDVVSLANNHAFDYRWKATADCISRLDAAGIKHAGAGADYNAATGAAIIETPAGKVAVIAASTIATGFGAKSDQAGINAISSDVTNDKTFLSQVTKAAKEADFVIVSLHWGVEYRSGANDKQIAMAHALVDAGADLILGSHPHVVQALEIYKDRLIVYSMGDFVFDHYSRVTGETFVLQVSLPKDGTAPSGTIIPVYLSDRTGVPSVVTGTAAKRILDRLTSLSASRGLQLKRDGDVATFGTPASAGATATSGTTTTVLGSTTTVPGSTTTMGGSTTSSAHSTTTTTH
jgi:poly-gamma-glutamate capsule biosynthesis protein CapA/YwtB (metallophosphatase superfamily)